MTRPPPVLAKPCSCPGAVALAAFGTAAFNASWLFLIQGEGEITRRLKADGTQCRLMSWSHAGKCLRIHRQTSGYRIVSKDSPNPRQASWSHELIPSPLPYL